MAEVTLAATFSDTKAKRVGQLKARQFTMVVAADEDVFTSGIKGIRECWWRGATTADQATPVPDSSTGIITLRAAGSVTGQLLVLSRG